MTHKFQVGNWLDTPSSIYFRYIMETLPDLKYRMLRIDKVTFECNIQVGILCYDGYDVIDIETKIIPEKLNRIKSEYL